MGFAYTNEEIEILKNSYYKGVDHCLKLMPKRSRHGLHEKARQLGLKVSKEEIAKNIKDGLTHKKKLLKSKNKNFIVVNGKICYPKPPGKRHAAYMAGGES